MKKHSVIALVSVILLSACNTGTAPSNTAQTVPKTLQAQWGTFDPMAGETIYDTPDQLAAELDALGDDPEGIYANQLNSINAMLDKYGSWANAIASYEALPDRQKMEMVNNYDTIGPGVNTTESAYSTNGVYDTTSSDILACPKRFSGWGRGYHWTGRHRNEIDWQGRPEMGIAFLPPVVAEARDSKCQSIVGNLGMAERGITTRTSTNRHLTYDGGHLLPTAIGGWKRRANMVPQITNLNQDGLSSVDALLAKCKGFLPYTFILQVRAKYPHTATDIPSSFEMTIAFPRNRRSYTARHISFKNESPYIKYPAGTFTYSPNATTVKEMLEETKTWLSRNGCS